jgi:hypothetical protein
MTREDHLKLFEEYVGKPKEELDAIINTGMFNSIIEGYLVLTLTGLNYTPEDIQEAQEELKAVLDTKTATEARLVIK